MLMTTIFYGFVYKIMFNKEDFGFTDSNLDPWYFSFTTMSTVGYGDMSPKIVVMSQQSLLILEGIAGIIDLLAKKNNAIIKNIKVV
jgi:hypothetical protein